MPEPRPLRHGRRLGASALAAAALLLTAACGADGDQPAATGSGSGSASASASGAAQDLVCGFFPQRAVRDVVGSSYSVEGTGMLPATQRRSDTASCTVVGDDAVYPPITAVVAELSKVRTAQSVRATLRQEAARAGCRGAMSWSGLGTGNLCTKGDTTSVAVLTSKRLIRVELTGRTADDRPDPATAVGLARDADRAAAAYDSSHS